MTGRHNVCANIRFMSMPDEPGFFRELVNLPARNLLPLAKSLSDAEGALAEPLAVILHSMHLAAPRPGETAVVFGAGPIGLLTIAMLKLSGVRRIWSVEPVAARRELARAMGRTPSSIPRPPIRSGKYYTIVRSAASTSRSTALPPATPSTSACMRHATPGA